MSVFTSFNDLARLTDREIQTLFREVDQKDLVVSLKGTIKAVTEKCMGNLSARVRTFIQEEIDYLGPMPQSEIEEVQQRIVQLVAQLVEKGQITWPPDKKKTSNAKSKSKAKPMKLSKTYLAMKRQNQKVAEKPLSQLSYDELNKLFTQFAEIARREGILALESMVSDKSDQYIRSAVRLAVDGTEPDLIMDILETWKDSLLHEQERKYQKVIEALMAIQSGDNPRIVEHKLSVLY